MEMEDHKLSITATNHLSDMEIESHSLSHSHKSLTIYIEMEDHRLSTTATYHLPDMEM